ncbi:uncharacterized protein LOC107046037 [Diachasma alloeum]|uniref:uncharacterized protein LOC107046037 n=1 Tax=Diachasma alloeum TaxID=454923 RepID=UPI0010FB4C26|nr:uncharacterized protein LOC107046037 [Diachasma alloeum]
MASSRSKFNIFLSNIITLLENTKRPISAGGKVLLADHIVLGGIRNESPKGIHILAACRQSSHLQQIHDIHIIIKILSGVKKIKCHCSCKAGGGNKCKHIFATLLYVNRKRLENLDLISSTDLKQQSGKIKSAKKNSEDQVVTIDKFCCYQTDAAREFVPDKPLNDYFVNRTFAGLPDSEAAIYSSEERATASQVVQNEQNARWIY